MKKRRNFTPEEKAKYVLEVLAEEQTLNEIAAKYEIQPNQLKRWKSEFLQNAARAFSKEIDETASLKKDHEEEVDHLHREIGQLAEKKI